MKNKGLVEIVDGKYRLTEAGRHRLDGEIGLLEFDGRDAHDFNDVVELIEECLEATRPSEILRDVLLSDLEIAELRQACRLLVRHMPAMTDEGKTVASGLIRQIRHELNEDAKWKEHDDYGFYDFETGEELPDPRMVNH